MTAVNLMLLFGASQVVLAVKNPPANVRDIGDAGLIPPGSNEDPGGEHGNLLQYSCLENTHGQRSLVGYSPWGHRESDMTERLTHIRGGVCVCVRVRAC